MSKPQLGAEEYRSAAFTFIAAFACIAVALMSSMPISEVVAPGTLLIVGAISLVAAVADLIIKYRRLQKGITTADILRQVERDIATGQHPLLQPKFRWSMIFAGVVGVGLAFLLGPLIG